jgi:Fe-S-cluster-containing dehydrogenase component/DMSO reductase anchor subunit
MSRGLDPTLLPLLEAELRNARQLTAVQRFSQHEHDGVGRYADLLPATPPAPGQQYAFLVNLDACTGCKACVTGCNSLNGLDTGSGEAWRKVGNLGPQPVTSTCHHCADPACLKGCPAEAYEKDALTGAVIHLDDACIGCSYCTMTCPYEVPTFSDRLGIVRKCDLCHGRLTAGEAPACVQACPTDAIRIQVVDVPTAGTTWALAAGPDPALTRPTTTYVGSRRPVDRPAPEDRRPEPASGHPALAGLLVMSQWAAGAAAAGRPGVALALVVLAATASVAHLGRPLLAWRAVLGWRHSWLSREVLALTAFAPVAAATAVLGDPLPLRLAATATGLGVVACSAAIYAVTGRRWWRLPRLLGLFGSTAVIAALAVGGAPVAVVGGAVLVKLLLEGWVLRHRRAQQGELARTARLLLGPLQVKVGHRLALLGLGLALLGLAAPLGVALLIAGDLVERGLLFRAASPDRMP